VGRRIKILKISQEGRGGGLGKKDVQRKQREKKRKEGSQKDSGEGDMVEPSDGRYVKYHA
jgi:hypothetical protein